KEQSIYVLFFRTFACLLSLLKYCRRRSFISIFDIIHKGEKFMAAQWVSFKTIKEHVSIEQILEHYGLLQHATRKNHELRIRCPFHDDSQPSFTAHTQKNGFHCFGCGAKGNIFSFVRLKEGIDTGEVNKDDRKAAILIAEWFGITSSRPEGPQAHPDKV